MGYVSKIAAEVFNLANSMSPYLLLGFLLAGILHSFVPRSIYRRFLSTNNMKSVFWAALFGIPLPLCSCGVIPTAMGLHRQGASKGATISFLIATPQTGVDSIFATYSLMGLPMAIIRPIAALITALMGGWITILVEPSEKTDTAHIEEPVAAETPHRTIGKKISDAFRYAFVEMMEDIGTWLGFGLLVAAIITVVIPDEWFAVFQGNSPLSILFVLLFSIPMYLCATGSIPIAIALMLKGLTPGAALVLLMAGPASNAASILVIRKVMGRKTLLSYLLSIVACSVLLGLGMDYLLPSEWFTQALASFQQGCCEGGQWFKQLCTVILLVLLVNVNFFPRKMHKHDQEAATEEKATYRITGMKCNHCEKNVKEAICSVEGVEEVEVELETGKAWIKGTFKEEELKQAVQAIGFEIMTDNGL